MNLASPRALIQDQIFALPKTSLRTLLAMIIVVFVSSLLDVYVQYRVRDQFIELQKTSQSYHQLQTEHRTLLLEQGALISPMRLMALAKKQGMVFVESHKRGL